MIKIEIKNSEKVRREVTRKLDNKTFVFYEQSAYAFTFYEDGRQHEYPESIKIGLETDQSPYAPGFYTITQDCIYVDRNNHLQLGRLNLKPIVQVQSKAA